jgi:hypothetical protein
VEPIRVGYNKLLGVAILAIAGAGALLQLIGGGPVWLLGLAAAGAVIGALYLVRPFLVVTDSAIRAKSLIGYDVRRFQHDGLGSLEMLGPTIILGKGERRQRIRLPAGMLSRRDLQRLAAEIDAAQVERVLPDQDVPT